MLFCIKKQKNFLTSMRKFCPNFWIHLIQELFLKYFSNLFGGLCIYKLYKGLPAGTI